MFNITGGEVLLILLVALIILGPDKLPDAVRSFGRLFNDMRRMSQGFQSELRDALEEPSRTLRETIDGTKRVFEEPVAEIQATVETTRQLATGAAVKRSSDVPTRPPETTDAEDQAEAGPPLDPDTTSAPALEPSATDTPDVPETPATLPDDLAAWVPIVEPVSPASPRAPSTDAGTLREPAAEDDPPIP